MKFFSIIIFSLLSMVVIADSLQVSTNVQMVKVDTIVFKNLDTIHDKGLIEKNLASFFAIIGVIIGAGIGMWSNYYINKVNRQKERISKLREHATTVFYEGRKIKGRNFNALISSCEHCLTILYNKDSVESEEKLYNNIKLIMDKAREMEDDPGADIADDLITEELIEETMAFAHDVFKMD